jgi:hypothetical protein
MLSLTSGGKEAPSPGITNAGALVRSYLMTFHITAVTTANTPNKIDVMVASKSPVSTYPSAVVRLVAGCNLSGPSVILEALRGSQTLNNRVALIQPTDCSARPQPVAHGILSIAPLPAVYGSVARLQTAASASDARSYGARIGVSSSRGRS